MARLFCERDNGMTSNRLGDIDIVMNKKGSLQFRKVSFPIRYGLFSEIQTEDHTFHVNLNGQIKWVRGNGKKWPHPSEWLKRTAGGDWVYYSAGRYSGTFDFIGEYYLPCLPYRSNPLIGAADPFNDPAVPRALDAWRHLPEKIKPLISEDLPPELKDFLEKIVANRPENPNPENPNPENTNPENTNLENQKKTSRLISDVNGARISVLPPDARHVDYEVIPVIIGDGCLYNCGFCAVKSGRDFSVRTNENIFRQINELKTVYGQEIKNSAAVFLGLHDSLAAGIEPIRFAAETAWDRFDFKHSNMTGGAFMFLFASVDSLLGADETLFAALERLPFFTYINIGLESPDPATLDALKKPVRAKDVERAFDRMLDINRRFRQIEISANLVLGPHLPDSHFPSCVRLLEKKLSGFYSKGTLYMSPLLLSNSGNNDPAQARKAKKKTLDQFLTIKRLKKLETLLYLIQRL